MQKLHLLNCYQAGRWLLEQGVSSIVGEVRSDLEAVEAEPVPENEFGASPNEPIRQDLRPRLDVGHPAFAERGIPPAVLEKLGAGYLQRPPRKSGRPDPMNQRLVFQIRGLRQDEDGFFRPVILGHIGRATTEEQEARDGKWWTYAGFKKSFELYNIDRAVLDDEALHQAAVTEHVIVVEGCFDVAKLAAAGIHNVVASFGCHLSEAQLPRFEVLYEMAAVDRFLIWYDRDQDGEAPHGRGAIDAAELLLAHGYEVEIFDWQRTITSSRRGEVALPAELGDPCDFSVPQLQWLRDNLWI